MLADAQAAPALAAVGAGEDLAGGAGQHGLGPVDTDRRIVDVGIIEAAGDARPGFPAVAAAPYPIDLDARPYGPMVGGIHRQRGHPRDPHIRAFLGHIGVQLVPMSPSVGRPEQRRRPGAGKDDFRVHRIKRDFPHRERVHRRVEPLEALAAVLAAVNPVIGAGEHRARLARVNGKPEYPAFRPQPRPHLPPALAAVRADPGAGSDGTDANRKIVGHGCFLPAAD